MEIKDAINEINKDYNFPGLNKLIKLVQSKYDFVFRTKILDFYQGKSLVF